ncbi:MAG: phosphoglycerate kinase [Candidatus Woesebacteria bacterium]|jgi:phosphoglycerate kinase
MNFYKKTVLDVPLDGQRVLVRADYNVPLNGSKIADDYRIVRSAPTIKHLLSRGCQVVICSHLGRPKGQVNPDFSLEPVAAHLGDLLGMPVGFITDCVGDKVKQATKLLQSGQVLLLENLRFYPEEEANDPVFAQQLAKDSGAVYFVQDGFGVVHRAHASTSAITNFLPSVAGQLLVSEVTTITGAMQNPKHPLVAILGGAKISDKIKVIERFIDIADQIIIGGAMANTFLKYKCCPIGKSIYEEGQESVMDSIYRKALSKLSGKKSVEEFLFLPIDVVVAKSFDSDQAGQNVSVKEVAEDDYILDVGIQSTSKAVEMLKGSGMVIWNGTMGRAEHLAFAQSSARVAQALADQNKTSLNLIGGGDTAEFVLQWIKQNSNQECGYISTGGGASLELMSGEKLPGVESLLNK